MARIRVKNEKYNTMLHRYEITLNDDSVIQRCSDDEADYVPRITYNFMPISQIANEPENAVVGELILNKNYFYLFNY